MVYDYNKLVRNEIPEIMKNDPEILDLYCSEISENDKCLKALKDRLIEKTNAFIQSEDIDDLAYIAEVIEALSFAIGSNPIVLQDKKIYKIYKKHIEEAFNERVFLSRAIIKDDIVSESKE